MREALINRKTNETDISLKLCLDGKGESLVDTGCGFLDHMLTLFSKHGKFDLTVKAKGDTEVDFHHLTEDVGICLGQAFSEALGDMRGIKRYGSMILPMDEALILTAVDISGRAHLAFSVRMRLKKVGTFDTELVREFFEAFTRHAGLTLHIRRMAGYNTHHIIEGIFKSFGRSLREAVKIDAENKDDIPSTKGMI
ncbi:MAG: imidazoleglycerol-phosphate dehydratase HisB [Oscillospiraceae bacterium]|nr:imidazoleglycerol-phosphate dehydratase HisB [Oscillospiraceae bacterium]